MRSRIPPGRLVAIASLVVLVVALALWAGRSGSAPAAGGGSVRTGATPTSGSDATPDSGLSTVAESRLPRIARDTLALIAGGGPYPFEEDGQTFQNRERILPVRARTYYREYTVKQGTRGDRGPLRIITGADGDLYWTEDHYDSFRQIDRGR